MGFKSPSFNVVIDNFSNSCQKMHKICLKRTLDLNVDVDFWVLTFCDAMGEFLPKLAETTFLLRSKLSDIPVSRVRKCLTYPNQTLI